MATPSMTPLFPDEWVVPGTHLKGVYTPEMHRVSSSIIQRAETIIVDSFEACSKQVGEVIAMPGSLEKAMELGELHADANVVKSREIRLGWLCRMIEYRIPSYEERIVVCCILDVQGGSSFLFGSWGTSSMVWQRGLEAYRQYVVYVELQISRGAVHYV